MYIIVVTQLIMLQFYPVIIHGSTDKEILSHIHELFISNPIGSAEFGGLIIYQKMILR